MRLDLLIPKLNWDCPNDALASDYPPGLRLCLLARNLEILVLSGTGPVSSLAMMSIPNLRYLRCLGHLTINLRDWIKVLASNPHLSSIGPPRISAGPRSIIDAQKDKVWPSVQELIFPAMGYIQDYISAFPLPGAFPSLRSIVLHFTPSAEFEESLSDLLFAHGKNLESFELCHCSGKESIVPSWLFPSINQFCPSLNTVTWRVSSTFINVASIPDDVTFVALADATTLNVEYLERERHRDEDDDADPQKKNRLGRRGRKNIRWDLFLEGVLSWAEHLPSLHTIRFSHEGNSDFLQHVYPATSHQFLDDIELVWRGQPPGSRRPQIDVRDEYGDIWNS